jgi:hypothetical protein
MTDEHKELPLEVEAELEVTELAPMQEPHKGLASLRGVKRSTYMRRSLLRMLSKSPEEIEAYEPRNGFETIAKNLVLAKGREGTIAVQVWREVKETLGERIGSRWKDTQEHVKGTPEVINDLPYPSGNA